MSKKYWIPQALTVSRMAAALVLGQQIVFAETAVGHLPVILALTEYIFLSDLLDGRLARKWAGCSPVGAKLDIAADLLYIVSQDLILIRRGWMPPWVLLLVLAEFILRLLLWGVLIVGITIMVVPAMYLFLIVSNW